MILEIFPFVSLLEKGSSLFPHKSPSITECLILSSIAIIVLSEFLPFFSPILLSLAISSIGKHINAEITLPLDIPSPKLSFQYCLIRKL